MANNKSNTWKKDLTIKLVKLFHIIAFIQYVFSIYYDLMYVHPHIQTASHKFKRTPYGGKFKYLTFWNIVSKNYFQKLKISKL